MSGLEVLAVVGAVAAVISAFNDGNSIVHKIKEKRRLRKAAQPATYLEESLALGPPAVEAERDSGIRIYGDIFRRGDQIAVNSLKDIVIELQGTLLAHLYRAQDDETITDFEVVVRTSDLGRIKAVMALCELQMRLAEATPIRHSPLHLSKSRNRTISWLTKPRKTTQEVQPDGSASQTQKETSRHFKESDSFRPHLRLEGRNPKSLSPTSWSASDRSRDSPSLTETTDYEGISLSELEENPWEAETHRKAPSPTPEPAARRFTSDLEVIQAPPIFHSRSLGDDVNLIKPQYTNQIYLSSPQELTLPPLQKLTLPSSENNYGGFCKGAWKLQVGDRKGGIKISQEVGPIASSYTVWRCASSKCCFQGAMHGTKKNPAYDTMVRQTRSGVRYRWSFLAKSHISLPRVKNNRFSYRCIFCCTRVGETPVFGGLEALMDHVLSHRGSTLPAECLHRAGCVVGRFARDEEEFDLNIPPFCGYDDGEVIEM